MSRAITVLINGLYDLPFHEALAADLVSADISTYLVARLNVIQFNPVGRGGTATVNVVVH